MARRCGCSFPYVAWVAFALAPGRFDLDVELRRGSPEHPKQRRSETDNRRGLPNNSCPMSSDLGQLGRHLWSLTRFLP